METALELSSIILKVRIHEHITLCSQPLMPPFQGFQVIILFFLLRNGCLLYLASCTFHPIECSWKAGNLCDMQALNCVVLLYYRVESREACHHVWLPDYTAKTGSAVYRSRN